MQSMSARWVTDAALGADGRHGAGSSAEMIVPERGGRVPSLRHCGLAGRSHGHYGDSVSDGEYFR